MPSDRLRSWTLAAHGQLRKLPWSPVAVSQGGKPAIGSESSVGDLGVKAPKQFGKTTSDSPLCLLDV
ncbi:MULTISPECIES: hypothetical protein [unclassified Streptomyces]|uniref:hypothetical protein n=1 Tax=unclassified Streptomyces TaxID=2593676 RepID=UPI003823B4ED